MAKWFAKMSTNKKALFIMVALAVIVFLFLTPLFFFHSETNYPLGAYPLGWLLGSLAEIAAYYSLMYMSDSLFAQKDPNRPVTSALAIGSAGIRILIYAIVLVVSGICTFKSAWFGGFNAFNFYTTAAGLLPMLAVIFLTQFFAIKKENSAPQGSGAQPSSEADKDSSQDEKK